MSDFFLKVCAMDICSELRLVVEKAEIVGSIRRGKPDPKDVEILVQCPLKQEATLFGDAELVLDTSALDAWQAEMIGRGVFALDEEVKRNGPRYRRFILKGCEDCGGKVFELFVCDRRNWGNQQIIRTGPAEYSHSLVTKRSMRGWMPDHLQQRDGYLWEGERMIECPTEEAFYGALGLPWQKPEDRE